MASKVSSLQKVVQASNFLVKNGNIYYKQLVEQNKHHIQEPPTIEKCQTLAKQLFYTRLARYLYFYDNKVGLLCLCFWYEMWLAKKT
ncbi:unnamed protein product [Prunus armeniaca]